MGVPSVDLTSAILIILYACNVIIVNCTVMYVCNSGLCIYIAIQTYSGNADRGNSKIWTISLQRTQLAIEVQDIFSL